MQVSPNAIEAELSALKPRDFNLKNEDAFGRERLYEICDKIEESGMNDELALILFKFLEVMSESDEIHPGFDLGTPGPVVHLLEGFVGFKPHLIESLKRFPTPLTIWMVNRILNVEENEVERTLWWDALLECKHHPRLKPIASAEVDKFVRFQMGIKE
jgi:hypothetical protein